MSLPGPAAALCAAGLFAMVGAAAIPAGDSGAGPPAPAHTPPHSEGPLPGFTGGFGEPTCAACHFGAPLNEPGATLELIGLEGGYRPGQQHPVTVRFESFDMLAAGFQGAFRFEDGDRRGAGAGKIRLLDDRVTVVRGGDGDTEYVQHTRAGSAPISDAIEWTFEWRAPETEAPVVLHIAANSGGGDDSPLDDLVYTASVLIAPTPDPARTQASR